MARPSDAAPNRMSNHRVLLAAALVLVCVSVWLAARLAGVLAIGEPQIRAGIVAVPEQEPLAIASARGALDPARVHVVEFFSLEDMHNAFLDGNVHVGVFTLDEALRLAGPPVNAKIERFVGVSCSPFSLMAAPGIATVADLRGRRVGLESGRFAMSILRELLSRGGLTPDDIQMNQLDADSAPIALEHGQVAAVLTSEPVSLRLSRAGAHALARWASVPGELMVLVSTRRAHQVAPGQMGHLQDAWVAGAGALLRPDTAATGLIARHEGIGVADVAGELATQHYLGAADERHMREPEGLATVDTAIASIAARWRALGVRDTVPARAAWLPPARKRP